MITSYIFDKMHDLKDKFKRFFVQKKKLQSLENFSETTNFEHKGYLKLIRRCMDDGFLGEKEDEFLGYLLNRYEINFLDWAHKTRWVKEEIRKRSYPKASVVFANGPQQFSLIDWAEKRKAQTPNVPIELLKSTGIACQNMRK